MPSKHPLFAQYPLNGSATISTGTVPTPYHIYNGDGVFLGGTADLRAVQQLLRNETIIPAETSERRAPMGLWLCNFTDASLGPHHELQFSFFTENPRTTPVSSHPLGLVELMTRPSVRMLCHGLWNNTPEVVAYNRELLSLNARPSQSHIAIEDGNMHFAVRDKITGQSVLSGTLPKITRWSPRVTWDLIAQLGVGRMWRLARLPWMPLAILNPIGIKLARNTVAQSFTKNTVNLLRYFDQASDTLEIGHPTYGSLDFRPQLVQYMKGFRFVYLEPEENSRVRDADTLRAVGDRRKLSA